MFFWSGPGSGLAIHPEYVKEMREGAESMIAEYGWTKRTIQKLSKIPEKLSLDEYPFILWVRPRAQFHPYSRRHSCRLDGPRDSTK